MRVRVICGTLGWKDENGRIRPKKPGEICEISDAEGERLCSLGAVEAVEKAEAVHDEEPSRAVKPESTAHYDRETLEDMKLAGLRILCEKEGIKNARRMTREECIAFLLGEDEEEEAELPEAGEAGEIVI